MWAFVDEYGNANLATEKEGVSQFFINASVLARGHQLDDLRVAVEEVRSRSFDTGEIKSKTRASDRAACVKVPGCVDNRVPLAVR